MPLSPKSRAPADVGGFHWNNNGPPPHLADRIAALPRRHDNDWPLWAGPCSAGPLGGITQSMLVRFMSCRERFRLRYVLGLEPHPSWTKTIGYGNMWHVCEEAHAASTELVGDATKLPKWVSALTAHTDEQLAKYPFQREEIGKWYHVCLTQFPEYVRHWSAHPDVRNRTPLLQEHVFDVPYALPSGRVVRLRGKFDSVDVITDEVTGPGGGIYLQENKSKGDIEKSQVERQLKFDLQTMLYTIALADVLEDMGAVEVGEDLRSKPINGVPLLGVRYNVVRRPLSGGKGSITQHKGTNGAKCGKCKGTGVWDYMGSLIACRKCQGVGRTGGKPGETDAEFYERLRRDYLAADPEHYFFRVRAEVSARDVQLFRNTCLDQLLETVCWWYDDVTAVGQPIPKRAVMDDVVEQYGMPPMNYRTPFGVWSALEEGGSTEYDHYMETGSEVGLRRTEELFTELQ